MQNAHTIRRALRLASLATALVLCLVATNAVAQTLAPTTRPAGTPLLDSTGSCWRTMVTWKTAVLCDKDGQVRPLLTPFHKDRNPNPQPVPTTSTAWPEDNWAGPDFDDRGWDRGKLPLGQTQRFGERVFGLNNAAAVALLCARGKFHVSDPAAVGPLKLDVEYNGGCVVYVNGHELEAARGHMPKGELTRDSLAEAYPLDAYLRPDGKLLTVGNGSGFGFDSRDFPDRFALRTRQVSVNIPPNMLRKGINTVAIEIHRAALNEALITGTWSTVEYHGIPGPWPHARLVKATVSAPGTLAGATPNIGRPKGVQLWMPDQWDTLTGNEFGDPCEKAGGIRLTGVRGGVFSGQFVVSADRPFAGLKVTASDLAGPAGKTIAASNVQIRWMVKSSPRFDGLAPTADTSLDGKAAFRPVWVTVSVPADAAPGDYSGALAVVAEGLPEQRLPLSLKVHGWTMTDPADYGTRNHIWQSHDSLAMTYKTPLWSDRHFELMGQSLELTRSLGNKFCAIHLITPAEDIGNAESFVRWVAKVPPAPSTQPVAWDPKAEYEYDFSVFDRYVDLYAAKVGKPALLLLDVWAWGCDQTRTKTGVVLRTEGPMKVKVSLLDRKNGQTSLLIPPYYGTPESVAFWKPVLDEVRKRLEKRGWMDVACFGTSSDNQPRRETITCFREIWPDVPWFSTGHICPATLKYGPGTTDVVKVRGAEWVWGSGVPLDPESGKGGYPTPWAKPEYTVTFPREGSASLVKTGSDLATYRMNPERTLQANLGGIGRVCADMWPIAGLKGRGVGAWLCGSPGQYNFHASITSFFDAAPDGPRMTARAQMFREGVQVREALIYLQRAAKSGKLDAALVAKVEALLLDRARNTFAINAIRGCQQREDALYALCAEVAAGTTK